MFPSMFAEEFLFSKFPWAFVVANFSRWWVSRKKSEGKCQRLALHCAIVFTVFSLKTDGQKVQFEKTLNVKLKQLKRYEIMQLIL